MRDRNVRALKNRLRNYGYNAMRIKDLNEKIDCCYHILGGVRAIDPSKEPIHNQPNKELEYKIRDDIETYKSALEYYKHENECVDSTMLFVEPKIKECIIRVFVKGEHMIKVADDMNYSKSTIRDKMDVALKFAINKKERI